MKRASLIMACQETVQVVPVNHRYLMSMQYTHVKGTVWDQFNKAACNFEATTIFTSYINNCKSPSVVQYLSVSTKLPISQLRHLVSVVITHVNLTK